MFTDQNVPLPPEEGLAAEGMAAPRSARYS